MREKILRNFYVGKFTLALLVLFEAILISSFFSVFFFDIAFAAIGTNATVITRLNVGNVFPEIVNVSINNGANSITLLPNSTVNVSVIAIVRDYNGENDLNRSRAEFFDNVFSSYGDTDDNNDHYTNTTCFIDTTYGDAYEANISCYFSVYYYANNRTWNATFTINDTAGFNDTSSDFISISQLLAVGLPDFIDYGTVNATQVSNENVTNVTNFGNVMINLSLSGYAVSIGDNLAMNCSLGSNKNISVWYEKYNLNQSNSGPINLTVFETNYTNLTSSVVTSRFNLNYRQNDLINDAQNTTYWRIYVPLGVAGTCQGNIVFGATTGAGI